MRWGMVIDLKKCIGCRTCAVACKVENGVGPGIFWRDVLIYESGKYPTPRRDYVPKMCMHCKDPMCKKVCPTGATQQRADGIVWVDYDQCIGCRACVVACPYEARTYRHEDETYFPEGPTPYELHHYQEQQTGVVQKCHFCMHRVDQGLQPACVDVCLAKACYFGDLDDPNSEVSRLIATRHGYVLLYEAGTDPSVFYLPSR